MTLDEFLEKIRELFPPEMFHNLGRKVILTIPWDSLMLDGWMEKMKKLHDLASQGIDQYLVTELESHTDRENNCMSVIIYLQRS